ncbi:MAG: PH domain-containing protein [Chloroflexota bacterium]|nr:PH domain-containing protein [Chloroflexota bacterium]
MFRLMVLLALWGFVQTILMWASNLDVVTTRRFIQVRGILSKSSFDSSLEKINDVAMQQSVIGRILGYGTVSIMTASDVGLNSCII